VAFAGAIGPFSKDLAPLGASALSIALFGLGVGLTSVSMVLDQALIGLLRGELQLSRNVVFAVVKLGALGGVATFAHDVGGFDIFLTWTAGIVASLACMPLLVRASGRTTRVRHIALIWRGFRLRWDLLRSLGGAAAGHHALNLALHAPPLALPLLVTAVLSATTNAYFYTAWMVAAFVFVGPYALTTVLYAAGARDPSSLKQRIRLTLGLATAVGVAANLGVLAMAGPLLGLFGAGYAEHAAGSLRILALEVFPLIVKDHYVTIARLEGKIGPATAIVSGFGALRLAAAAGGAVLGGLEGLAIGWVGAACLEAAFVAGPVVRVALSGSMAERAATEDSRAGIPARSPASIEAA
jgi:O-antigen/teichoic acid export membrane protein